ncbi:MAG TPA: dihydrofolate reductase family protein [Polyangiaceae bacterium]
MRKIVTGAFISLDGVIQAPGGPEEDPTGSFRHGGWTVPLWDDAIGAVLSETFSAPFDLLLGRKTYDIFAAHWPYVQTDPKETTFDVLNAEIANKFTRLTKYVATHRPESLTWENSQALGADVVATLREIKQTNGPILLTQGSSELIQTLLAHDLIDEFRLLVYPVVLGKGKRLFGSGTIPAAFKVTKSAVLPNGVMSATYERAGTVTTGSFAMEVPTPAELERRKGLR